MFIVGLDETEEWVEEAAIDVEVRVGMAKYDQDIKVPVMSSYAGIDPYEVRCMSIVPFLLVVNSPTGKVDPHKQDSAVQKGKILWIVGSLSCHVPGRYLPMFGFKIYKVFMPEPEGLNGVGAVCEQVNFWKSKPVKRLRQSLVECEQTQH